MQQSSLAASSVTHDCLHRHSRKEAPLWKQAQYQSTPSRSEQRVCSSAKRSHTSLLSELSRLLGTFGVDSGSLGQRTVRGSQALSLLRARVPITHDSLVRCSRGQRFVCIAICLTDHPLNIIFASERFCMCSTIRCAGQLGRKDCLIHVVLPYELHTTRFFKLFT